MSRKRKELKARHCNQTVHTGVITYQPKIFDWITGTDDSKLSCKNDQAYLIDKDSWSVIIEEISLNYVEKSDKLIPEGYTPPCLHFDAVCKPTLKHPYTIVWFPEELCLLIPISDFIGRMSKIENR